MPDGAVGVLEASAPPDHDSDRVGDAEWFGDEAMLADEAERRTVDEATADEEARADARVALAVGRLPVEESTKPNQMDPRLAEIEALIRLSVLAGQTRTPEHTTLLLRKADFVQEGLRNLF